MSVREHKESFSHMNWPNIIESLWGVLEKTEGMVVINTKSMQLWVEINVVDIA